jgi:tetratricopeptide (TPR) repeat protein
MRTPLVLLRFFGKGLLNAFGGGVGGDLLFDVLPEVAADVWQWWGDARDPDQRRADLAAVAGASPAEVRADIDQLVREIALDRPAATRQALGLYLSLIPGQVRKSLRRPSDPTGSTVAFELCPAKADDLLPLLPTRLPRFKAGDRPLPGVDWELDELLGIGGFGEVWRARNPLLNSVPPVALKFCLDQGAAQFLRNEAAVLDRVMRQGRHPGIIALQHTYLSAETPCLEYEFVGGGDLAGLIQKWQRSTPRPGAVEVSRTLCELARVVGFAHSQEPPIVHRDLKPANVLRHASGEGPGRLKVADFGIGGVATRQAIAQQTRGTTRGLFLHSALRGSCTPLYASPQQMRGEGPDPRDDVYALGVIWYQMLTGDLTAGRPGGTRWQKRLAEQGVPAGLVELLGECFEDDPQDRVADAGALAERLAKQLPPGETGPAPAVLVAPLPFVAAAAPLPTTPPVVRSEEEFTRRKRELEESLAGLEAAVGGRPGDAQAWARRGEVHRLLGKQDLAVADCTEAIRIDPRQAEAYATRGSAYRMKGQLDLAVADCTQAVGLDPANLLAWYNRGEAYRLKGDLERAVADCTEALRLDPGYSWAYGTRGAALRQKGELARAVADLGENIRLDPAYAWAWAVRGEAHRLAGDFDRAIADCSEALRLQPGYSLAYATRGAAFRQKGDFATAAADLSEALRLRPDYQWARDQLDLARRRRR